MKYIHQRAHKKGQTIVEAIVVIGVVIILVTGLISGTTASLRTARDSRIRSDAVKYAQQSLEIVRSLRDENWTTFQSYSGLYCMGADNTLVSAGSCSNNITTVDANLTRSVRFSWLGDKMEVTASVDYLEGSVTHTVPLSTYFTQWK